MNVKGSALRSTMTFLRERYPEDFCQKVVSTIPPAHRAILEKPIQQSGWYDATILYTLMHIIAKASNENEEDLFFRMGKQSCDDGLNTIYKIFFKVGSPTFILKHVAQVWGNYYSEGRMVLLSGTSTTAHMRLEGVQFPDESLCHRIRGWMVRASELSGGKNVRVFHETCVHRGGTSCEWKGAWE